jgi:low temperature requirement protein LtrA
MLVHRSNGGSSVKVSALRPPRLRTTDTEEERKVTWTELFYDLVFVVAVAGLGARLLEDPTIRGAAVFSGLFVPLWWAWAGFTFYADRYDTDDLGQRVLAVAQMATIALMAASVSGGETDSLRAFALAYVGARVILIVMYLRARRHVPETRNLVGGYVRGMSIALVFWLISVFVPEPYRYILWAIGLLIDFYTPYRLRRIQAKVPLDVAHLPERFGLFTILVLGESIAATVAGLSHEGWKAGPAVTAVLAVVVAAGLWWVYFDNLDGTVVRRRAGQKTAWKPTVWIYGHLPLVIGLMATAIGLESAVIGAGGHAGRPTSVGYSSPA